MKGRDDGIWPTYLHKLGYEVRVSGVVLLTEQNNDQCHNVLEARAVQGLRGKSDSNGGAKEVGVRVGVRDRQGGSEERQGGSEGEAGWE